MNPESVSAKGKCVLAFMLVLGLAAIATPRTQAQTFSVVYNFSGSDGANPLAGFTADAAGNLYGTTDNGGSYGNGAVFKLDTTGQETVLYSFTGAKDGSNPEASLLRNKAGNLYGTTSFGGAYARGTVFRVNKQGQEKVLYSFTGGADGSEPEASIIQDSTGDFFGTTTAGGAYGGGVVFHLSRNGKEKVLYNFGQGTDGATPIAGLNFDAKHNLYGTTSAGGAYGYGTVFQLKRSKSGWTENTLHDFQGGNDGTVPYAGLIVDRSGNLYGGATGGGTGSGGIIFELSPSHGGWTYTVIYNLPGWSLSGPFRNLMMDASGNLYGTTHCDGTNSSGTVYKLTPSNGTWTYASLYVFTGGSDGQYSFTNPILDKQGNLYGTTQLGGANGLGVVFKIMP